MTWLIFGAVLLLAVVIAGCIAKAVVTAIKCNGGCA